ncbi:MAG: hypothetical protein BGO95_07020 [Micrococcales bacterium 73-13]|nr:MAG: hypothetical protein BGO95_07020 [Micrococcales bacterium 73-13]
MPADGDGLPPIEEWWPGLTIGAKHAVLSRIDGPLDERVREEIERITGRHVPEGAILDHVEIGFVETQQQPVD